MAKTKVSFRLSDDAINILRQHQTRLGTVDRTDALEDILLKFQAWEKKPLNRIKKFLQPVETKPLEAFASA